MINILFFCKIKKKMLSYISYIYLYIKCWLSIPNLIIYFFTNINNNGPQEYIRNLYNILSLDFPEYL